MTSSISMRMSWRRRAVTGLLAGGLAAGVTFFVSPSAHGDTLSGTDPYGGIITDSAVTVHGRKAIAPGDTDDFSGMTFTVNQTTNLTNQALSVSWTGGKPTVMGANKLDSDFVQIMQCWGPAITDPADGVNYVAGNPGPSRENCEYGANPPSANNVVTADPAYAVSRTTNYTYETWNGLHAKYGTAASPYGYTDVPFRASDGTAVAQTDTLVNGSTPNNSFFDYTTTNEVDGAQTYADGTGHVWFQADTAYQAPGLGCGAKPTAADSNPDQCWLVIVPRGETEPDGNSIIADQQGNIVGSPLTPQAWSNRIAIPLDFQPLTSTCSLGSNERETTGSQLITAAMTSWQPVLCANNGPTFGYSALADSQARSQLSSAGTPMVFTNLPLDSTQTSADKPVTYSPVALSGVTIAFNIQYTSGPLAGQQVMNLNLTPRLVAKLLTMSYRADLPGVGPVLVNLPAGTQLAQGYEWLAHNPYTITQDPDFQQYNPQLAGVLDGINLNASSLIMELGNMDAAKALWQWVMADPAAKAWLAGQPDPWGMVVDPYYLTTKANPSGIPFNPVDSFPVNDPWKNVLTGVGLNGGTVVKSQPLTMLDYHPYAQDLATAAREVRSANDGERTSWTPGATVGNGFSAIGPQLQGQQFMMAVTDTVSAQQYGLQPASLSAAGDDGPNPAFVAPNTNSLLAGVTAMKPQASGSSVLWPNPAAGNGAYPLTMITYAATIPADLSSAQCVDYASLLQYAAGAGQQSGTAPGDLPLGYVPLPSTLLATAGRAALQVAACKHPASPTSSPTVTQTVTASADATPTTSSGPTATTSTEQVSTPPATASVLPQTSSASAPPPATAAPSSSASSVPQLLLAAGTTPKDPSSFNAALPVGLIVGALAALAAPLMSGAGLRTWLSLKSYIGSRGR